MKKQTAVFINTVTYGEDPVFITNIKLVVDYSLSQFTITPALGIEDKFDFTEDSRNYEKWKAILIAIDQCIDFGNKELGNT
jgi:hypothetical protein